MDARRHVRKCFSISSHYPDDPDSSATSYFPIDCVSQTKTPHLYAFLYCCKDWGPRRIINRDFRAYPGIFALWPEFKRDFPKMYAFLFGALVPDIARIAATVLLWPEEQFIENMLSEIDDADNAFEDLPLFIPDIIFGFRNVYL